MRQRGKRLGGGCLNPIEREEKQEAVPLVLAMNIKGPWKIPKGRKKKDKEGALSTCLDDWA